MPVYASMYGAGVALRHWHSACDAGRGSAGGAMNIRMQLIRAAVALAIIGSVATAETLTSAPVEVDCPFAKATKPQRIMLLDPIQKHPTWIDARGESPGDIDLQKTADSHEPAERGIVTS